MNSFSVSHAFEVHVFIVLPVSSFDIFCGVWEKFFFDYSVLKMQILMFLLEFVTNKVLTIFNETINQTRFLICACTFS